MALQSYNGFALRDHSVKRIFKLVLKTLPEFRVKIVSNFTYDDAHDDDD